MKIRGFRIELGEIEAQLLAQPQVREAVVVAKAARVIGYVVGPAPLEVTALRERLAEVLPDYMVPSALIVLEQLPLNGNGKVDRAALPDPEQAAERAYEPPQNDLEHTLAAIWADVLGLERVGRQDDFFELGGDSILNLQIVARARAVGWKLTPKQLFEHRTVAGLACVAEPTDIPADEPSSSGAPLLTLSPAQLESLPFSPDLVEDVFALTPMQQGMLLHTLLDAKSGIYLMQHRYAIGSAIDVPAFWASWDAAIETHAALRAAFFWLADEQPFQAVQRSVRLPKLYLDLRHLDRSSAISRIDEALSDELAAGFDMARAPLLRVRLAQLGEQEFHLVVSFHHILMDAWCFSLLMAEVLAEYDTRVTGVRHTRERPAPYRDFIAWLMKQDTEAARQYWRRVLTGFDTVTPLPMKRRAAAGSSGSRMIDVNTALTAEQTTRLNAVAQRHQITPNTLIQGAWAYVLARYANVRDVLFGVTVAGRPAELPRLQKTLGLFINTIPLRVSLPRQDSYTSVAQWLRALLARNVEAREFEHLPLIDIQALSGLPPERPLFDSLFVFENAAVESGLLQRAQQSSADHRGSRTHTNYPITVMIVPDAQLLLQITYDARLVDHESVERLLSSFRLVVEQFIENPAGRVEDVRVLTEAERRTVIAQGQGRVTPQAREHSYVDIFRRTAAAHASRTAARCEHHSISYGELDARSDSAAALLQLEGVRSGDLVIVFSERGLGLLRMVLGCFKAGAAYLAVDVSLPLQRVAKIAALSHATAVLVEEGSLPLMEAALAMWPEDSRKPRIIDASRAASASAGAVRPVATHPEQPAYVIFTSGSTGEPKGVVVTSQGMLNNQLSKIESFPLGPSDVIAQTAAQSFDISVWQLLGGLLCGACIDIVPNAVARDPIALLEHVRSRGITVLESVPSMMQAMLACAPMALPSLRVMMATGEAVKLSLARAWQSRYPNATLINAYGPAECADDVALHVEPAHSSLQGEGPEERAFPIGRAVDNMRLCVLDSELEPVPVGVAGELYVAGIGVGQGYRARVDLTAERFVADVFSTNGGGRMYRTGDIVRLRMDGAFEYLGRVDHQVKVRGYRVELGEIEALLAQHELIRDAVVTVAADQTGGQRLVAYVVSELDTAMFGDDLPRTLRTHLSAHLPDYMVPSIWMQLDALPVNANGKVDRSALPAPELAQIARDYRAPVGATQALVADIWKHVLGLERVGLDDNFFELGGHSLTAMQVIARVQSTLRKDVPLNALFDSPTLERFAASVDRVAGQATDRKLQDLDTFLATLEAV